MRIKRLTQFAVPLALALAAYGCGGGGGEKKGKVDIGPVSGCDLPTVKDNYVGFEIGKPEGWALDSAGGALVVKEDAAGKVLALVYPVMLQSGQGARQLFDNYSKALSATAEAAGGNLDFTSIEESGSKIEADVGGSFGGASIRGKAKVTEDGREGIFAAYWAPEGELDSKEQELSGIVSCYSKERGSPLEQRSGSYFSYVLPPGWKVAGETQNGIDISAPQDAGSVDFGYLVGGVGTTSAEQVRDFVMGATGITGLEYSTSQDLGEVTDQLGTQWQLQATEFEGLFQGSDVHGVITVAAGNTGYGSYSTMSSIRIAKKSDWDGLAAALALVQDSIKISSTSNPGAGVSLPANQPLDDPLTGSYEYRNQVEDRLSQDWQEAIMGYENVESPTTGDQYQAPLNSYDPAGSDGPGYYRELPDGGTERLQESAP